MQLGSTDILQAHVKTDASADIVPSIMIFRSLSLDLPKLKCPTDLLGSVSHVEHTVYCNNFPIQDLNVAVIVT